MAIVTAFTSMPSIVPRAAAPPVSASFTAEEVCRLVRDVAVRGNAALLKVPYFLGPRHHRCSRAEGLWIISEALAEESQGTRRWILLKSIYGFGCLRTGPAFRRDGFNAYRDLFTSQRRECDPSVSGDVSVAMSDYLRAIASRRVRARDLHVEAVEVLGLVARLYLACAELNRVELDFGPAASRLGDLGGRKALVAAAQSALADEAKHCYWTLKRAALVYKAWQPREALTLLQSAESKLPKEDAEEVLRFHNHLIDLLVSTDQTEQAVAVAEKLLRLTGKGGARLALLRQGTDGGVALKQWIADVDYAKVSEKELDEAVMRLREAGQTSAMETVLSHYLEAERTRTLGYDLWARYRLGCLLLSRKAGQEAREVLLGARLDREPEGSRASMYRRRIQQLIRKLKPSNPREEAP